MKKTTYIIDTSVIIASPFFFKDLSKAEIIIPIVVISELDKLKKFPNEVGKSARVFIKYLDTISEKIDLSIGVAVENNLTFKVDVNNYNNDFGDPNYGDNKILACANDWNQKQKNVYLLTNDFNLRIRARSLAIQASRFEASNTIITELYSGFKEVKSYEAAEMLLMEGEIEAADFQIVNLQPNQFVIFLDENEDIAAIGRHNSGKIKSLKPSYPWGLSAKNKEQSLAINLLMDPKIQLTTIVGAAGTGKSLIALASALEMVLEKKMYEKIMIYKPVESVGKDIGFLPGELHEKMAPYFQSVMDSLEFLLKSSNDEKWKTALEMYKKKEKINFEALTYIRGRSVNNALMIIDEVQNLDKESIKTILTRVGHNTKIILLGDINQIDNKDLDPLNNGLTYVVEKFKTSELSGHITLFKGERSPLAEEAAQIL